MQRKTMVAVCFLFPALADLNLLAQNAAPKDLNAVNNTRGKSDMMADSPVTFPEKGALPSPFPPDVKTQSFPAEKDYSLFESPCRSLAQIRVIQAQMPTGTFAVARADWSRLPRTRKALTEGGSLHILGLGDSIINDTMRSGWVALLRDAYPKASIKATVYVRGGGNCKHYRAENRVQTYLLPLKPDLVIIGGISQGKDYAAIRDVVGQIRAGLPDCEFLFTTGVFGSTDPRSDTAMAAAQHSGTSDYGRDLKALTDELGCAYFDMTTPWLQYIRSSGLHPHLFYRDRVHANPFGEQILAKIMLAGWTP
jgi:lysophospholipase L1-like esterase